MLYKDTYFLKVFDPENPDMAGYGECALFAGLSADDCPHFEDALDQACRNPLSPLPPMSAIRFGFETALADYNSGAARQPFDSSWSTGKYPIAINGLIWMGDKSTMLRRVAEKLESGFKVLKLKIGGIDFDEELSILRYIRRNFSEEDVELRLDANGNFSVESALEKLKRLSDFRIHSIEQPIAPGQTEVMADICQKSPIAIALDEELIGCRTENEITELLTTIMPQYIILKPSLCGGFSAADNWIARAVSLGIGWWATSALESNIGLNAIARWVNRYRPTLPQGLGTGELFENNIQSPLYLDRQYLNYDSRKNWNLNVINGL